MKERNKIYVKLIFFNINYSLSVTNIVIIKTIIEIQSYLEIL